MPAAAFRFVVPEGHARLDRLVADATGRGRRLVREWFQEGRVTVDGHHAFAADIPSPGHVVAVAEVPLEESRGAPPDIRVIVETPAHVIVAKPAGLHCERGKSAGCVADALEGLYEGLGSVGERPGEAGLVHRLDRDTSGVLLAARHAGEYRRLRRAFRDGLSHKHYLALVSGRLDTTIEVDLPLARRAGRMAAAGIHDEAFPARTTFEPLDGGRGWTLALARMSTGVTHQVRVHAAAAGYPLFGDALYEGPLLAGAARRGQLLHALRLQVGDEIDATVGPPGDFLADYALLRRR